MWCVLDTAPADLHAPPAGRLHAMHGVDLQAETIIEPGPDGAMISSTRSGLQVMGRRVCCLGKQDWWPEKLSSVEQLGRRNGLVFVSFSTLVFDHVI